MTVADQVEKVNEQTAAMRSVSNRGLCIACRKDPACRYLRYAARPVLQCEEFEGFEPRAKGSEASEVPDAPSPGPDPIQAEVKGLCISCANRCTCAFPKPAGGIWHCEEFR